VSANSVLVLFGAVVCLLGAVVIAMSQSVEREAATARALSRSQGPDLALRAVGQ